MTVDCSRFSFNAWNDFLGVIMQQGRVQLDSDWNEFVSQIARRFQAGTLDTVGRAVVPRVTADGFRIDAAGRTLTIGPGRIYVDGMLAENHGAIPFDWDPVLAELKGSKAISYDAQPYYPNPEPLPIEDGPHLVYVDVWQREVTYVQHAELVEKAVGVDTTARVQTVWQVKVLPEVGNIACDASDDDIRGWVLATQSSAARLSIDTVEIPGEPNPCLIPPRGGYLGLENQLYRIEIQEGGPVGTATFKWSRDNAIVASPVLQIPSLDTLIVETLGRDEALRFKAGDWVEITDDGLELHGKPGELRRIRLEGGVNETTRTITLDQPLNAGLFPVDAQGNVLSEKGKSLRNTRVRRWDQKGLVRLTDGTIHHDLDSAGGNGAIPVPQQGVSVLLEHGIVARFDLAPTDGHFKVGDYWVFFLRGRLTPLLKSLCWLRPVVSIIITQNSR